MFISLAISWSLILDFYFLIFEYSGPSETSDEFSFYFMTSSRLSFPLCTRFSTTLIECTRLLLYCTCIPKEFDSMGNLQLQKIGGIIWYIFSWREAKYVCLLSSNITTLHVEFWSATIYMLETSGGQKHHGWSLEALLWRGQIGVFLTDTPRNFFSWRVCLTNSMITIVFIILTMIWWIVEHHLSFIEI